MSKSKKTEEVQEPEVVIPEVTETLPEEVLPEATEEVQEPVSIPDVPAQMDLVEVVESGEISFLRKILSIQHEGGWGSHLDDIIYARIASLK
jgi:hypothetical protein